MTFPLPVLFSLRIDSNTYWHQLNSYLERVHGIPVHNFLYVGLFIQLSTYQACVTTNQLANQIELYHAGFKFNVIVMQLSLRPSFIMSSVPQITYTTLFKNRTLSAIILKLELTYDHCDWIWFLYGLVQWVFMSSKWEFYT